MLGTTTRNTKAHFHNSGLTLNESSNHGDGEVGPMTNYMVYIFTFLWFQLGVKVKPLL